jgi:hypothetical protein
MQPDTKPNNVTPIESKKPATVATHTISYVLDGFPITTQLETSASIRDVVGRLKALGAEPPQASTPEKAVANGAPLCPVHNVPMKASRKPGKFYCAKKADDGEYCREVA